MNRLAVNPSKENLKLKNAFGRGRRNKSLEDTESPALKRKTTSPDGVDTSSNERSTKDLQISRFDRRSK